MAFCTGSLATIFLFVFGNGGDPQHDAVAHLPVHDRLPALRGAAVHLHGGGAGEGRASSRSCSTSSTSGWARCKGGLASATVLACTVLAAMVGVVGATEVTMGMIALPAMLQARLRPEARLRLAARRRHARHPDPAVGDGDRLRGRGAAVAGRAADRLGVSRACCCPGCTSSTSRCAATSIRASGPRCRSRSASSFREKLRLLRNTIAPMLRDPAGARRDLLRHRDAGRGGRHRHLRRAGRLRAAPPAQLDQRSTRRRSPR